ncbi:MAG TPA: condensation domain-containing protein, partial [Nitrospiraceae bacterium]|nr:condensation domain-containing protein [Nitrospiraceae bacterium]
MSSRAELQQAILRNRLKQRVVKHKSDDQRSTIARADRSQPLPLSWSQQRLWFLDQLDVAAGAAYHMSVGLCLKGHLNAAALKATLDRVIARHEILRTRFVSIDGTPRQEIAPAETGFTL